MLLLWNKIIRRLAYLFTHSETQNREHIAKTIHLSGRNLTDSKDYHLVTEENLEYKLRKVSSDYEVFKQVVINEEYQPLIDYFHLNNIRPRTIIDCGANIGLTSIQFAKQFVECKIIAVEPDKSNTELLLHNTKEFPGINVINKAIWSTVKILKLDRGFRDGKDWSLRTIESSSNGYDEVETITIDDLIDEYKIKNIDLLKIDIEGAEAELFKNEKNYQFLEKVSCIAIEIHSECIDKKIIESILLNNSFILFNSGELTIGIKK